jgi:Calpain family cysteine protease
MNVQRAERAERYDHTSGPEPEETKSSATAAQRAAGRLESWIDSAKPATVSFEGAPSAKPTCGFRTKADVDACGTEAIPGATLFVHAQGDVDAIDANDIGQRGIGDCHLLGPAMAMLQSPEGRARIREMVKEETRDGRAVYEVTFRIPVERTIRERIAGAPPHKDVKVEVGQDFVKGHAVTGDVKGRKTEVWPLVLESAYAKLQGGYDKINGGIGTIGLANLTGKKAEEKTLERGLLTYSASNLKKDFAAHKPMCITFTRQGGNDKAQAIPKFGAYGFHCYAVKDVYEKGGETYVQMKNPWGHTDPKPIPLRELEGLMPQVSIGQLP